MGFLNMEDKTRESLDEDGWLHSGDLGKIDEEGFLYITGRIKGRAISGFCLKKQEKKPAPTNPLLSTCGQKIYYYICYESLQTIM